MANSLTDWLAKKVLSSSVGSFDPVLDTQCDDQAQAAAGIETGTGARSTSSSSLSTLLDDVAYLRGAKVQITRFFTPIGVKEVEQDMHLQSDDNDGDRNEGCLWACVADRIHSVHVRFSSHCVARFNSTHSRELISLRGAVIALTKFRPSVSFIPSALENKRNRRGPFAPPEPILATLFLEVESFDVLGSINEVIFWDSKELQYTLLQEQNKGGEDFTAGSDKIATATTDRMMKRAFQSWFRQVEKMLIKEQRAKSRRRLGETGGGGRSVGPLADAFQASRSIHNSNNSNNTTSTGSTSAASSSGRLPPPFQKPVHPVKHPASLQSTTPSQTASTRGDIEPKQRQVWGDFQLSQMGFDDDEGGEEEGEVRIAEEEIGETDDFGLEAAASQMLDNISASSAAVPAGSMQSQAEEGGFDPFSLSLSTTENEIDFATDNNLDQDVVMSAAMEASTEKETYDNSKSLPATFPMQSEETQGQQQERRDSSAPPSRQEDTRFSPAHVSKEASQSGTPTLREQQAVDETSEENREKEAENMFKLAVDADSYIDEDAQMLPEGEVGVVHETTPPTTEMESRSLFPPGERSRALRVEQASMTSPEPSSGSSSHSGTSSTSKAARRWNNVVRRPTPEEMKERERTYASRIDLIVD